MRQYLCIMIPERNDLMDKRKETGTMDGAIGQLADDRELMTVSDRLMEQNAEAYEVLAQ